VAFLRLDPARAVGRLLLLPERSARLQVIHQEFAGSEGVAAVRARHDDEHDRVRGLELAVAMDHRAIDDLPAAARFFDDLGERFLGHAGIVLERHCDIPDLADKTGDRSDALVPGNALHFQADIEFFPLNGNLHPPVTGGKKATSSPALTAADGWTMS